MLCFVHDMFLLSYFSVITWHANFTTKICDVRAFISFGETLHQEVLGARKGILLSSLPRKFVWLLTHCGRVTSYGIIVELGQHWYR